MNIIRNKNYSFVPKKERKKKNIFNIEYLHLPNLFLKRIRSLYLSFRACCENKFNAALTAVNLAKID